jgi:hypothetical protein
VRYGGVAWKYQPSRSCRGSRRGESGVPCSLWGSRVAGGHGSLKADFRGTPRGVSVPHRRQRTQMNKQGGLDVQHTYCPLHDKSKFGRMAIAVWLVFFCIPTFAFGGQAQVIMYDNLSLGRTILNEARSFGSDEIGDDVNLVRYEDGHISDFFRTASNVSDGNIIENFSGIYRFYNRDTMALLGSYQFGMILGSWNIQPGGSVSYGTDISDLRIPVAPRMFVTVQYTSVLGGSFNDIGVLIGGPTTRGSSSRFVRNFTTGQDIDLGGDSRNLGYRIHVRPIPSPSALGVFGLAAVFGVRRRRL